MVKQGLRHTTVYWCGNQTINYLMQDEDTLLEKAITYFKAEARKAFAEICQQYDFVELKQPLNSYENQFQLVFESPHIRIKAEGINWGMNATIYLSKKLPESPCFGIGQFCAERMPTTPISGSQTEQLYGYAHYLQTYATDILSGDPRFLDQLEATLEVAKQEAAGAKQTEVDRKLAAGYISIDNPYGEPVLRKFRANLPPYETAQTQFSQAKEIAMDRFADSMVDGDGKQGTGIIDVWFKEIGDYVQMNECVCEVSTDKVCMEINSLVSGQLVWLLPEGTLVQTGQTIALVEE